MNLVRIIICGSKGRMGQVLLACAKADPELQLVGEVDQGDDLSKVVAGCDAIMDFSVHDATAALQVNRIVCDGCVVGATCGSA